MSVLRLTVEPAEGVSRYSSTLLLEGERYDFVAYTSTAIGSRWMFDLYDSGGDPVVLGDTLAIGVDLLRRYRYRSIPPGILWCNRIDDQGTAPTPGEFYEGTVGLFYATSDDPLVTGGS